MQFEYFVLLTPVTTKLVVLVFTMFNILVSFFPVGNMFWLSVVIVLANSAILNIPKPP